MLLGYLYLAQTLKLGHGKTKCNIKRPISFLLRVIVSWVVVENSVLIMLGCLLFLVMVIYVCLYMLLSIRFWKRKCLCG